MAQSAGVLWIVERCIFAILQMARRWHAIELLSCVELSQSNVKEPWEYDEWVYKERYLVECFFQKIKWFRRVATRYDKSDDSFRAFVYLAAIEESAGKSSQKTRKRAAEKHGKESN
jgi:transposase